MANRLSEYSNRLDNRLKIKNQKGRVYFTVEEMLCVYVKEHRDFTLNLLANISAVTIDKRIPIHIDLSNCPNITASASVMFFAEISRIRIAIEVDDFVTVTLPKSSDLLSKLESIGWIKAINAGYQEQNALFLNDDIFQTLSEPGKAMASLYLRLKNSGVQLTSPEAKIFTRGVNEAMLNVLHHAYSHDEYPLGGIGRRWWQACYTVAKDDEMEKMVYIICDFGQGILNSLPKDDIDESVIEHLARAMTVGVTCTGEADRGKGSGDIVQVADIRDRSVLFVGTNNAVYGKVGKEEPEVTACTIPFLGTVIEWQILI